MVRGHAMYGSPYRNYNSRGGGGVGFGRGHPKRFQPPPLPPQPPPPPPRKVDVFEEAGRLAAEYLVSKGLLPPNALSGKWQNGNNSFKNRDFQFLRAQQQGDNNLQDSRTLAFARLGGDAADGAGYGSGQRRSVEDFNPNALRDYLTGRGRMGSLKGYGSDESREFGRSGSWSNKGSISPDMEGNDNASFTGYMEQQAYSDAGNEEQKLLPNSELSLKHDALGNNITSEINLVPKNDEGMRLEGQEPTDVTFLSLLHACGHVGLLDKGMEIMDSMERDFAIHPRVEHHACVVDMLGRAGLLNEAKSYIERLAVKPDVLLWQALLGACSIHGNSEVGKYAAYQLSLAAPDSPVPHILMANIYSSKGKWEERAESIKRMKGTGVAKETGASWIEIERQVHSFVVSDHMHPQREVINGTLLQLLRHLRDEGYMPDNRFILHYLDS